MSDLSVFLEKVDFFKTLNKEEIKLLSKRFQRINFKKGDIIFKEGDPADGYYIVYEGKIEIWKDHDTEKRQKLASGGPEHIFGEMALIDDLPRSATVEAVTKTVLLFQKKDDFQSIIMDNSAIALSFMKSFTSLIRNSNNRYINSLREKNIKLEKAYQELEGAQQKLLRNERLSTLGKFSTMVLHDIKNPISVIQSTLQLIILHKQDQEKIERYVENIKYESQRLLNLASELVDYSRGEIRLNREPFILNDFFQELKSIYKIPLERKECILSIDCDPALIIWIDRERLRRVLSNLIENALKAMKKDGGQIRIEVQQENARFFLIIHDNGEGMDRDTLDQIFVPFYSASRKGGSGLGLYIVKNIVEAHGGTIMVESQKGKGSSFILDFPLEEILAK